MSERDEDFFCEHGVMEGAECWWCGTVVDEPPTDSVPIGSDLVEQEPVTRFTRLNHGTAFTPEGPSIRDLPPGSYEVYARGTHPAEDQGLRDALEKIANITIVPDDGVQRAMQRIARTALSPTTPPAGPPVCDYCGEAHDPNVPRHPICERPAETERLRDALDALVKALDACKPGIDAAFTVQHIHEGRYTGPAYGAELEDARALLAALTPQETDDGN